MKEYEEEIARNAEVWKSKALLRDVYDQMYERLVPWIDDSIPGPVVEIGAGIGNFGGFRADVVLTDQVLQPWIDLCCDAYRLPVRPGTISNLVLVDVFHHLSAPAVFFDRAWSALAPGGRVIVLEPYISLASLPVYGLFHSERIGWRAGTESEPSDRYYVAQGNATRFFFRDLTWLLGWRLVHREAFSAFAYLFSGGFSRPAFYPRNFLPLFKSVDDRLSRFPKLFGARCLVVFARAETRGSEI